MGFFFFFHIGPHVDIPEAVEKTQRVGESASTYVWQQNYPVCIKNHQVDIFPKRYKDTHHKDSSGKIKIIIVVAVGKVHWVLVTMINTRNKSATWIFKKTHLGSTYTGFPRSPHSNNGLQRLDFNDVLPEHPSKWCFSHLIHMCRGIPYESSFLIKVLQLMWQITPKSELFQSGNFWAPAFCMLHLLWLHGQTPRVHKLLSNNRFATETRRSWCVKFPMHTW